MDPDVGDVQTQRGRSVMLKPRCLQLLERLGLTIATPEEAGENSFAQGGGDEIVLAAEVIVERPLVHASPLGDSVHADATNTFAIKAACLQRQ